MCQLLSKNGGLQGVYRNLTDPTEAGFSDFPDVAALGRELRAELLGPNGAQLAQAGCLVARAQRLLPV